MGDTGLRSHPLFSFRHYTVSTLTVSLIYIYPDILNGMGWHEDSIFHG